MKRLSRKRIMELKKQNEIKFDYVKLFRLYDKFVKFTDFMDWCETGVGKKWLMKNQS